MHSPIHHQACSSCNSADLQELHEVSIAVDVLGSVSLMPSVLTDEFSMCLIFGITVKQPNYDTTYLNQAENRYPSTVF